MSAASFRPFLAAALLALPAAVSAQIPPVLTPNIGPGPGVVTVGGTTFANLGLQGVGRISSSALDDFGDTFGSVSSLQIDNWAKTATGYSGTFFTLPDRGFNNATQFSDFAARIQTINFTFTPYTAAADIGGTTLAEKVAAQNQIQASYVTGAKLTYPNAQGLPTTTTGLDPGAGTASLLGGVTVPFVTDWPTGSGGSVPIQKLALDAEGLVLKRDGSGYVSDEYGPYTYHFNSAKQITGALPVPAAIAPHTPAGTLDFNSVNPPANGRRNNQGMEGMALTPDGKQLYALVQSATVQDTGAGQETRNHTRLLVYDVGAPGPGGTPSHTLTGQYVVKLPVFDRDGTGPNPDRTAAQSEIVALGNGQFLILSRDGNGLGSPDPFNPVFKSVLLADISGATNILGAYDAEGGAVAPGGVLAAGVQVVSFKEALNMLTLTELAKFNFNLNGASPDKLTLSEKWEGMSLVSALDPANPNDYFLFIANDNDFLTPSGTMPAPGGGKFTYLTDVDNDTVFLAYRITIAPVPEPGTYALMVAGLAAIGWVARRRANRRPMY